jgi:hypothetical protein
LDNKTNFMKFAKARAAETLDSARDCAHRQGIAKNMRLGIRLTGIFSATAFDGGQKSLKDG